MQETPCVPRPNGCVQLVVPTKHIHEQSGITVRASAHVYKLPYRSRRACPTHVPRRICAVRQSKTCTSTPVAGWNLIKGFSDSYIIELSSSEAMFDAGSDTVEATYDFLQNIFYVGFSINW